MRFLNQNWKRAWRIWRIKRQNVGANTYIDPTVQVLGWTNVRIGANCVISENTWLNSNDRSRPDIQIDIGAHSLIGRRNFMSSGRLIAIGPFCLTGPDCKIVGSDHIIDNPFVPYISSGASVQNTIRIGTNCWLGGAVSIVGNVNIGHGTVVGANAMVVEDAPPFSIVVGSPARVVKRFDRRLKSWVRTSEFDPSSEALLPSEDEYEQMLLSAWPSLSPPKAAAGWFAGDLP